MSKLRFKFKQFLDEINAVEKLTADFLEPTSTRIFEDLREQLQGILAAQEPAVGASLRLSVPDANPIRTRACNGEYEPGGKGSENIQGALSFVWDIRPLGPHKRPTGRCFEVCGLASTRVRFLRVQGGREIAQWRMEFGDTASPGVFFHAQVLGTKPQIPFPSSIPVPRLPTFIATPMSVLDYLLGELFQDDWAARGREDDANLRMWRSIQQDRYRSLLSWQMELIKSLDNPGSVLKSAKPDPDLLINARP